MNEPNEQAPPLYLNKYPQWLLLVVDDDDATLGTIKPFAKCLGDEKCNRNLYKNSLNKTIRCRDAAAAAMVRVVRSSLLACNVLPLPLPHQLENNTSELASCLGWKSERDVSGWWCPFSRSFTEPPPPRSFHCKSSLSTNPHSLLREYCQIAPSGLACGASRVVVVVDKWFYL